jgi:hypothetical protein
MNFIDRIHLLDIVRAVKSAHPDGEFFRQSRHEEQRLGRRNLHSAIEMRLLHAEHPLEVWLLEK